MSFGGQTLKRRLPIITNERYFRVNRVAILIVRILGEALHRCCLVVFYLALSSGDVPWDCSSYKLHARLVYSDASQGGLSGIWLKLKFSPVRKEGGPQFDASVASPFRRRNCEFGVEYKCVYQVAVLPYKSVAYLVMIKNEETYMKIRIYGFNKEYMKPKRVSVLRVCLTPSF